MKHKILIVEDDPATRILLSSYFENEGYSTFECDTSSEALQLSKLHIFSLALIDIVLSSGDGLSLTRQLRAQSHIGIILLTHKSDTIDRIIGLELGADAYIQKPFDTREVLAYAKNILWRFEDSLRERSETRKAYSFDQWTLDLSRRKIRSSTRNVDIPLTPDEFSLLKAFLENPNRTISRDDLLNLIRSQDWMTSERTIDILVGRLRKKLGSPSTGADYSDYIVTIYGKGYLFNKHEDHL